MMGYLSLMRRTNQLRTDSAENEYWIQAETGDGGQIERQRMQRLYLQGIQMSSRNGKHIIHIMHGYGQYHLMLDH
jgi:hypothetical protein